MSCRLDGRSVSSGLGITSLFWPQHAHGGMMGTSHVAIDTYVIFETYRCISLHNLTTLIRKSLVRT